MKKILLAIAAVASFTVSNLALAQVACPGVTTRVTNISGLVSGNTMCAARAPDRWQEFHQGPGASGNLIDWKLGAGDPVDPTEQVGTWSSTNGANSSLTHTYTGGSFTWLVCTDGAANPTFTLISFAAAGTVSGVKVLTSQVACP